MLDFEAGARSSDPVKTASQQADDKLNGVIVKVSKWRSVVVLAVIAAVTLVLPFVTFGLIDPFSMDFWVSVVYNLVIASLCYYIFIPFGARAERLESRTYAQSISAWTTLSDRVRKEGLIEAFYGFCTARRQEEREENRLLLIEAAGIPIAVYREQYANLSKDKLNEKMKENGLTKKQKAYLRAANGEIKVRPINPSMILSGLRISNINDVGRERGKKIFGLLRPLTLIVTMVIRGAIAISGNTDVDIIDYLTQTVVSLFIIMLWSFTGFRYGISNVRDEEQLVRGRCEFLSMFLERAMKNAAVIEQTENPA